MAVVKDLAVTIDIEATRRKQLELLDQANRLYDRYAKPFEDQHGGKFIAIAPDGRALIGDTAREVGRAAKASFGPGNFVFKLGARTVGKWR